MIKILRTVPFFAPAYGYGGPVVHTLNVSKIQASLGYDVRIFTTNILTNNEISKDLPKYELLNGIKIHRFPIKLRIGKSHYFITPSLPHNFLKYDYDIIHSHSFRNFQTDVSTIFSKLKKKPFVFTAHGTLRDVTLLNWLINKEKESKRVKLYDFWFKNFFLHAVDKIIVHSKYEKLWTLKNNIPEKLICIIPHGVNLKEFSDMTYRENFLKKYNIKNKMILYVGRLLRGYRNLDHIIKAMNSITKEIKDVKLWLIGESFDKEYELELKRMIIKLNLENYVNFILKPSREDIIGAYQTANVVVFPITDSDSFGIPLLEAGAAKKPIISTNRGPAPELVNNGQSGILTEIGDTSQLKEALLKILTDKSLEEKMGLNGYKNILKNYTWEIITKRINKVYEEII